MNNPINPKEFSLLANLPAGKTLHVGEWEILDPLAKGGFGEAYLVRKMIKVGSSAFEVKAVLKLVRTNVPNVGAAVHSLLNEMRNLSQLNSRYIAKFIEVTTTFPTSLWITSKDDLSGLSWCRELRTSSED